MNILIGSSGLLGSEIKKNIGAFCPNSEELNLARIKMRDLWITALSPEFIINCGAISNVDKSETDSVNPFLINSAAVFCLAQMCRQINSTLIHISTDYVYSDYLKEDGKGWEETDSPSPTSTYGKIKLSSEALALVNPKTYVLRVSSLYGTARSCHSEWVLKGIKEKKPVNICDDMIGSPTYTSDLAKWIKALMESKAPYGIYNCVPDGHVSRFDFAQELVSILKPEFNPLQRIKINDMNLPSDRPSKPILNNEKWKKYVGELPTWRDSLLNYVAEVSKG